MAARGPGPSGEDALIARYFKPLASDPGAFDLTDDAAILRPSGDDLVLKTDAVVEGVHFLPDDPPDTVARKALRRNLSDLASKGAAPAGFLLTLALRRADEAWLTAFAYGLGEDARQYGCPLLGGDTVSTPGPIMVSISAFGHIAPGRMVHRRGASPGDRIAVSGTIGDAVLGLDILKGGKAASVLANDAAARQMLIERYRVPQPRTAIAQAIRDHASAAMDISDGLAGDLAKLCLASGVSAAVDVESIPLSSAAAAVLAQGGVGMETLVAAGDDYEILCSIPESRFDGFAEAALRAGVRVSSIGTVIAGTSAPEFLDAQGRGIPLAHVSYSHF